MAVEINGDGLITVDGTSTTQGRVRLKEDTDNGSNYVELTAAASVASNRTVTFPDADINFASGLGVAQGGTGATTLTANNVIPGNGTSAVQFVAAGTTGNVLTSNGTTWTSSAPAAGYVGPGAQTFTGNGTFTIPSGITKLKVTVVGGGGGGAGANVGGGAGTSQVASGTQSITTVSATGGGGGSGSVGGSGGIGSSGDLNIGGDGGNTSSYYVNGCTFTILGSGKGGSSILGGGGASVNNSTGNAGRAYGGGGAGGAAGSSNAYAGGGGGGAAIKWLSGLTPGNTLSVTVGGAGAGGTGGIVGGAGAAGVVIFEW
jgi:hypothetical protein